MVLSTWMIFWWLLWCILAIIGASHSGRSKFGWFLMAFFLGPVGLLSFMKLPEAPEEKVHESVEVKVVSQSDEIYALRKELNELKRNKKFDG